ncbi:MAG: ATP-binding protein [Pirellulales bacterium]|nr:ATP-binding protein [Pirellulales bacterium]
MVEGSTTWVCGCTSGNFLAGPENRLVVVAVRHILERRKADYSPVVFHGACGTGKSHLAAGIAAAWQKRYRGQRVAHTSAADFARDLAEAIETQAVDEFRAKHRGADLLIVEDLGRPIYRRSDKLNAQEELVAAMDALSAARRWVIVTASTAPGDLPGILPALLSRLSGGLTVPLSPPGPEARLLLLQRLAQSRGMKLPAATARVLADGLSGTALELAGALWEAMEPCGDNDLLDPAAAREYVDRRRLRRLPSLHEIALAAARHFAVRLADMRGPSRRRALVAARGVAMYLARRIGRIQLNTIGRYFGGRDHATVLHGIRRTETCLKHDPNIHEAIDLLQNALWKT